MHMHQLGFVLEPLCGTGAFETRTLANPFRVTLQVRDTMLARRSPATPIHRSPRAAAQAALIAFGLCGSAVALTNFAFAEGEVTVAIPPAAAAPSDTAPAENGGAENAATATGQPAQPEAPPPVNPELKAQLDRAGAVSGQRIHTELLRRFYAA